jgi:hypothetical protein
MVNTGDQAVPRVSRQIAPWAEDCQWWAQKNRGGNIYYISGWTYSLTADVGVPDFGIELHGGGAKRIVGVNLDVDDVGASFIWRARGTRYLCLQVRQVGI